MALAGSFPANRQHCKQQSISPNSTIVPLVTPQIPPKPKARVPHPSAHFAEGWDSTVPSLLVPTTDHRPPSSLPLQHPHHPVKILQRPILNHNPPSSLPIANPHPHPQHFLQRPLRRLYIR